MSRADRKDAAVPARNASHSETQGVEKDIAPHAAGARQCSALGGL